VRLAAEEHGADVILIDHALSPSQERNLERHTCRRVLDRNALILDIFAQRARSHEGKLEVELAQLKHLASRLVRGWTHLERQKGGIGLRGPGETQLETDRRLLAQRVRVLTRRLEKIGLQRETGRQARAIIPIPSVALVGYTNAGKSTLFRALTGEEAYIADQLFATLDPTVRRIELDGGTRAVLADTVGFIRELPHELVATFRSTLTEAREATLLLHVVDASDPRLEEHVAQVNEVLEEIDAAGIPQVLVYNKIDRLGESPRIERDEAGLARRVWISVGTGTGLEELRRAVAEQLACVARPARVVLPATAGALRAKLYASGAVRAETTDDEGASELLVELPDAELLAIARTPGARILEVQGPLTPCAPPDGYLQSGASVGANRLR
jgi:GTPase